VIVAVHQPNYLPWLGYFAKIAAADIFVFLDDVQFSKGSYTNRVQIARNGAAAWLSVPVRYAFGAQVGAIEIADADFRRAHLESLKQCYRRAGAFETVFGELSAWMDKPGPLLAPFNARLVEAIASRLGLRTKFLASSALGVPRGEADERLAEIVHRLAPGGTYLSGSGGGNYQSEEAFSRKGVALRYSPFRPAPYSQSAHDFIPGLSIIDALFHLGWDATASLLKDRTPCR
jgi:hypothetical protein